MHPHDADQEQQGIGAWLAHFGSADYFAHLLRVQRHGARCHADREDAVQEAALALLRRYRDGSELFDEEGARKLLWRVVMNKAFDIRKRAERALSLDCMRNTLAHSRNTHSATLDQERACLETCVNDLSERDRTIVLRRCDGVSFAAIGSACGITKHAAKSRFQRIKRWLQHEVLRRHAALMSR